MKLFQTASSIACVMIALTGSAMVSQAGTIADCQVIGEKPTGKPNATLKFFVAKLTPNSQVPTMMNIRSTPNNNGKICGNLLKGKSINVRGSIVKNGKKWYLVINSTNYNPKTGKGMGWILADYARVTF